MLNKSLSTTIFAKSYRHFQIYFGVIVAIDLLSRLPNCSFFYEELSFGAKTPVLPHFFAHQSLYLILLGAVSAGLISFRKWPLVCNLILNLVYIYLYFKNPYIADTGDKFIRVTLIWSFLFELENLIRSNSKHENDKPSISSFGWTLQIALIYLCTGILKMSHDWLVSGAASYNFIHLKMIRHDFWNFALDVPNWVYVIIGDLAVGFEFLGGLFILLFNHQIRIRKWICTSFILFHIAISAFANVGMISWISIGFWILLLPQTQNDKPIFQFNFSLKEILQTFKARLALRIFSVFTFSYILLLGIGNFLPALDVSFPENILTRSFLLNQHWAMFAPTVMDRTHWLSAVTTYEDGSQFDVWQDQEASIQEPKRLFQSFADYRWMVYAFKLVGSNPGPLTENLILHICDISKTKFDKKIQSIALKINSVGNRAQDVKSEFSVFQSEPCRSKIF